MRLVRSSVGNGELGGAPRAGFGRQARSPDVSRRAAVFAAAILLAVTIGANTADPSAAGPRVADATSGSVGTAFIRPPLTDPITIKLNSGIDRLRLSDARDYVLDLPTVKKTGVLEIRGGRNIWVIGGYLSVAAAGPNIIIADGPAAIDGRVVHLEGILINSSSGAQSDGIRIKAPRAIVQIVKTRIVDLKGSTSGLHADVIQPFGGIRALRIDGLTASSHYNNLYLRRENDPLGPAIGEVTIYNANLFGYWNGSNVSPPETLRAISIGTQAVSAADTTSAINCQLTAPVTLQAFYIQPARKRAGQFVYPHDKMQSAGCPATISADGLTLRWPLLGSYVNGSATIGSPPTGDFVPAGAVGLNYLG